MKRKTNRKPITETWWAVVEGIGSVDSDQFSPDVDERGLTLPVGVFHTDEDAGEHARLVRDEGLEARVVRVEIREVPKKARKA